MSLIVYNTLTNRKQEFIPIEENKVKMYVCGVTVYDDMHMGHARSIIVFDMIVRYLRYKGYDVEHVTNFTDVDDKIINRANEMGIPPLELSARYIERFFEDIDALGVKRADRYPRASEVIEDIIDMIQEIIDRGYGYEAGGSVYFSVDKVEEYGRLSGQRLEDMVAGARVEVDKAKRNPMDFALWKASKPGEIAWDSPWGKGRPGWHIECSVMCRKYLGDLIDIHGGGSDLIFPHHENEILQTRAVTGQHLANYWIHNGMLEIRGEKMSKSLGNFFIVKDVLKRFTRQEIRFFMLNTHYRGPLTFGEAALEEAATSLKRVHNAYIELRSLCGKAPGDGTLEKEVKKARDDFVRFMDDDFNTRGAIAVIFELIRETNRVISADSIGERGVSNVLEFLEEADSILGILPEVRRGEVSNDVVQILIEVRDELRRRKIYDLADKIRERLDEMGIVLEDTAEGVRWRWK